MSDITYLLNFILNNGVKQQKSIWMKKKNYNELELIPSYVYVVTFAQANLPLSHLAFGWFTLGPYSNPPNPTGWRCTLFHPNWCSPPDKISLKGSKISKFRRTAIMPWHLYSGVLQNSHPDVRTDRPQLRVNPSRCPDRLILERLDAKHL